MGTPAFAVPTLRRLATDDRWDVVGVITATDKLGGRGKNHLIESAVKKVAIELGIPILQPPNLKSKDFAKKYQDLEADLAVVVAFRMLPKSVLSIPKCGTINLHGSLLPKYRGAAPINWAIINGDKMTGLTTFIIVPEIDTGAILMQREIEISPDDDAGSMHDKMMNLGSSLVRETVEQLLFGKIDAIPQDSTLATKAPKIFHKDCEIDFTLPASDIHNFVRGLSPYPGAWIRLGQKELKLYRTNLAEKRKEGPNEVLLSDGKKLWINDSSQTVEIEDVKLEGRKRMNISAFLNGYQVGSDEEITLISTVKE